MPKVGLELIEDTKKKKSQLKQLKNRENRIIGEPVGLFRTFYGENYTDFIKKDINLHGYSFDRAAGIDIARLYLLAAGFSFEDVFTNQVFNDNDTPEETKRKSQILSAKLEAGQMVLEDLKKSNEEIAQIVANKLTVCLPGILEKMDKIGNQDYRDPLKPQTKSQLMAGAISSFMLDLFQETSKTQVDKKALKIAFDEYNRTKAPEDEPLSEQKFIDLNFNLSTEMRHADHQNRIREYLNQPNDSERLNKLFAYYANTKLRDQNFAENVRNGRDRRTANTYADIVQIESQKGFIDMEFTDSIRPALRKKYSDEEIENAIVSGDFMKSVKVELNHEGQLESLSCMGIEKVVLPGNMQKDTKEAYTNEIRATIDAVNGTDRLFVFGSSENYKKFVSSVNDMKKLLKDDKLNFHELKKSMKVVQKHIDAYREAHKGINLSDSQKERLQVMDRVEKLYQSAKKQERIPATAKKAPAVAK